MIRALVVWAVMSFLASLSAAQIRVGVRGGALATSALVHDSIVQPVSVRPDVAPNLGFWIESHLNAAWLVSAGVGMAWGRVSRHSPGSSEKVVPVTVWSPTVGLTRRLGGAHVRASIGAVAYHPDHSDGNLFAQGAPILPLVGLGVGIEREMINSMRYALELGYDAHRFTTTTLRTSGFSGEQLVHRLSLSVSLSRVIRD